MRSSQSILETIKISFRIFGLIFLFSIVFPRGTYIRYPSRRFIYAPFMQRFIKAFLIVIVLYHILITVIQYGIFGWAHPELPAILRDGIRFLFIFCVVLFYVKDLKSYLKQRKRPRICLIILVIFSVGVSYVKGKDISDMLIGIKYGFLYLPIFLSATFVGHIFSKIENWKLKIENFVKRVKYFLITILIVWFVWQISKFIRPNRFMTIGYGPFQDFVFGAKPPIYYLTGYQGTSRRSWIFSWPNNYGYFLIAFLPAIIVLCKNKRQSIKLRMSNKTAIRNSIIIALWIAAIVLTLSRTAAIGWIVALAVLNIQRIKKHKKIARWLIIVAILWVLWLSVLKWASTLWHLQAKFGSLKYVLQSPSGYGLGTSWPAVHHNGTILPENYFLQLMLDIGTIGFILWALVIRQIQNIATKIKRFTTDKDQLIYKVRLTLTIGWLAMLVMGLFLHVFEDSMVNYIFFVLRGVMSGYLFTKPQKSQ